MESANGFVAVTAVLIKAFRIKIIAQLEEVKVLLLVNLQISVCYIKNPITNELQNDRLVDSKVIDIYVTNCLIMHGEDVKVIAREIAAGNVDVFSNNMDSVMVIKKGKT